MEQKSNITTQVDEDYTECLGDLNLTMITKATLGTVVETKCLKFPVLKPDSTIKIVWDMAGIFIILYQSVMIPYRLSFIELTNKGIGYFELADITFDCFFIVDLLMNF